MNIPAHIALAASLALGTVEEQEETRPAIDLRGELHGRQLQVWEDTRKFYALLCSRRAGKSEVVIRKVCDTAKNTPDTVNPYISITRKHAKLNFWKLFKRIAQRLDPDVKINESDLTIDFPGGGMVWLGGADKISELEKYRASKCAIAVVDECGVFPSDNLRYVVEEVIEPALIDLDGVLILSGTPGKVMVAGQYWFDLTGDHAEGVHRWNIFENPFIPNAAERLAALRERRGWTDKTPAYVREYLGKWCDDPSSLVFPFSAANWVDALPAINAKGLPLDPGWWRFAIGIDVGMVDETAIVILATHRDIDGEYVVRSEKHRAMLPAALAQRVRQIRANVGDIVPLELAPRLDSAGIVMDTGGMGKVHAEEFARVFALPVIPAQKTEKESAIEFTRGRVQSAHIKVLNGEQNDALRGECAVVGWDEKQLAKGRRVVAEHSVDHAIHAFLYGHRWLHAFEDDEPAPGPRPGTRAAVLAEAERIKQERIRRLQSPSAFPAWDR